MGKEESTEKFTCFLAVFLKVHKEPLTTHRTTTFTPQHKRSSSFDYSLYNTRCYKKVEHLGTIGMQLKILSLSLSLPN